MATVKLFISYTAADRPWAEWIAWQLETAGYETLLQAWDFAPGTDFVHEMQRAVEMADRTMAVLSPAYVNSAFGEAEWRAAFRKDPTGEQGLLVPVRVQACDPPGLLSTRVYVDLVGLDEVSARDRLLGGIQGRGRPGRPHAAPIFPGKKQDAVSRNAPAFPGPGGTASLTLAAERPRLLVVDDNPRLRQLVCDILEGDYECIQVEGVADAKRIINDESQRLDCAIVDLHLTEHLDASGLDVIDFLKRRRPRTPRILMTASQKEGWQEKQKRTHGIFATLVKSQGGHSVPELRETVEAALATDLPAAQHRALAHLDALASNFQRRILRQQVEADNARRQGDTNAKHAVARWNAVGELLEIMARQYGDKVARPDCHDPEAAVTEFAKYWADQLQDT